MCVSTLQTRPHRLFLALFQFGVPKVDDLGYNYGPLSRADAEQKLWKTETGTFLVRTKPAEGPNVSLLPGCTCFGNAPMFFYLFFFSSLILPLSVLCSTFPQPPPPPAVGVCNLGQAGRRL